ncbi:MAG: hypothetical protein K1X72_07020 [Pyrinomonadaceae bacterium]|nr:hypothetical protein [Pyrinomonadaceae bacterium]
MKVIISVLFLILIKVTTSNAQSVNFTKEEKSKIVQILLKTFEPKFRKQKKILILTELTPKEIIGLFPKKFNNRKVAFISDKQAFRLRELNLFYYYIYPFNYKEGTISASITRSSACFGQYYSYRFIKQNGKIKKENIEAGISRCGSDKGPEQDDDPPPKFKIIKPQ